MKLLITGVSGQLGSEIYSISNYENFGIDLAHTPEKVNNTMFKINIAERDSIFHIAKKIKPDCFIHCAAMISIEGCENDIENAWKSNVIGTKNVVDACKNFGSKIVFTSTEYVFDGTKGFYKEIDSTNPINFYGKTKLIGEWLTKTLPHYTIIRTSSLLSNKPGGIFSWILQSLERGKVSGAIDVINSPTLVLELAESIIKSIKKDLTGVYHMAGDSTISRYDLIKKAAYIFGYNPDIVKPATVKEIGFKAPRPNDTSLDISKVKKLGIKFSNIDDALKKLKKL